MYLELCDSCPLLQRTPRFQNDLAVQITRDSETARPHRHRSNGTSEPSSSVEADSTWLPTASECNAGGIAGSVALRTAAL